MRLVVPLCFQRSPADFFCSRTQPVPPCSLAVSYISPGDSTRKSKMTGSPVGVHRLLFGSTSIWNFGFELSIHLVYIVVQPTTGRHDETQRQRSYTTLGTVSTRKTKAKSSCSSWHQLSIPCWPSNARTLWILPLLLH
jgi:hypothetical protein